MLSKAEIKQIKELQHSRTRQELGLFVVEGHKLVGDMLGAYACKLMVATKESYELIQHKLTNLKPELRPQRVELVETSFDFGRISGMRSPQSILALYELPTRELSLEPSPKGLSLLLDEVQDPGNVGTIIRTADWFGIDRVYLSIGCADPYSPKVLQATMGAMSRVEVISLSDTSAFLSAYRGEVLGTFLEGESIYTLPAKEESEAQLLVLGNEGKGISPEVSRYVSRRITIPPYKAHGTGSESLNVATASAICLSELRRNTFS